MYHLFESVKPEQAKMQRMHIPLALLYVSLMAAPECTSLPIKVDYIGENIHNILYIANITLVHIGLKTELQVLSQVEVTPPPIKGLTGISSDLRHLDHELQNPSAELWSQIQADVSSLEGRVRSLARMMECPVQDKPNAEIVEHLFPVSQHYETLAKVQKYLQNLNRNEDKLKVC